MAAKYDVVTKRRWQDDLDDLREFANVPEQFDDDQEQKDGEQEEDEFGRGRDLRVSASEVQRRKIERQQRIAQREDLTNIQEQGLWSDDDLSEEWEARKDQKLGKKLK